MKGRKIKNKILMDNPKLELNKNGDFRINKSVVADYEIIDFHCHTYSSLSQLFPPLLQKEKKQYQ